MKCKCILSCQVCWQNWTGLSTDG